MIEHGKIHQSRKGLARAHLFLVPPIWDQGKALNAMDNSR